MPLGIRGERRGLGFRPGIVDPADMAVPFFAGTEQVIAKQHSRFVQALLSRRGTSPHIAESLPQNTQDVILRRRGYKAFCPEWEGTENLLDMGVDKFG